jgi:signal transduction histidine kinase
MRYRTWQRLGRGRLGFAGTLAAATSILLVVTCAFLTWVLTKRASEELTLAAVRRGWALAHRLASESELGVLAGDEAALRENCSELLRREEVASCAVFDARGTLLVGIGETVPPRLPDGAPIARRGDTLREVDDGRLWELSTPVVTRNLRNTREELQFGADDASERRSTERVAAAGYVVIGLSSASVDASQKRLWLLAASFASVITLLGVAGAVGLARSLTRPIQGLVEMARAIAAGRLDATVAVESEDELGALAASFNEMARSLEHSQAKLFDYNRRLEAAVQSRTRQLEEMNQELRLASELKSEFLATISHELRTPLNVIIGYTEILRETALADLDSEQRSMLEAIDRYTRLQLDLITNVLDFTRLSSGRIALDVKRFALEPALADVAALHADSLARRGLDFRLVVDPAVTEVQTDRVKLQEIVRNLLDNAVKFTQRGSIEIAARPGADASLLVIEVRDSGKGISPEDLPNVFDEFWQVGRSSTRSTGGVGLGLAIVRRLCQALGGSVRVESALGHGSTFVVQVPTVAGEPGVTRAADDALRQPDHGGG